MKNIKMIKNNKKLKTKESKAKDKSCIKMLFQCNDIQVMVFWIYNVFVAFKFYTFRF